MIRKVVVLRATLWVAAVLVRSQINVSNEMERLKKDIP